MRKPPIIKKIYLDKELCKKVYFGTKEEADRHIEKINKTSVRDKKPVRSYLCHKCHCWHLTSWDAPDILKIVEAINTEIESVNTFNEREYEKDNTTLNTIMNEHKDLLAEVKKLRLENYILKNSRS